LANVTHENLGIVLQGDGVSEGIVLGTVARWDRHETLVEHVRLPESLVNAEVSRFHDSIARAEREIDELYVSLTAAAMGTTEGEHLGLLDAHKLMLRDPSIVNDTERYIREEHLNAEWALSMTLKRLESMFAAVKDPFFRERGQDIHHIGERLMQFLAQSGDEVPPSPLSQLPQGAVLFAHSLSPAEALAASRQKVAAFVIEAGSTSGHTAIIARSLGIPAVVGLQGATDVAGDGDRVIVDGFEGEIVVRPTQYEEILYGRRANRAKAVRRAVRQNRTLPAETPDGFSIVLKANLDFAAQAPHVDALGGQGVGLYRTEFLFLDRVRPPTEEEQTAAYVSVLEALRPHPVTIRTLDVGGDKLIRFSGPEHAGLRAIRYCLANEELFLVQLRALLRASRHGELRILVPFIAAPFEIREVRRLLAQASEQLAARGIKHAPNIPVGAMIEIPVAALSAEHLAKEVDFFSVGTNDLMQYTMAIARDTASPDYLTNPLQPGFLRLLHMITRAGHHAGIVTAICGELAGKPSFAPILIALGFNELSMTPESIPLVKEVIRRTPRSEAMALLQKFGNMSAEEAKDYLDSYMVEHFPDIVTPRFRGAPHYMR
jgi:phosphotransferase system enzyme I (PtsI)